MKFPKYHQLHSTAATDRPCDIARRFAVGCLLVASFVSTPGYSAPFNLSENGTGFPIGSDTLPVTFAELPHSIDGLTTPWPVDIGNNVFQGSFGCSGFNCGSIPTNNKDVFRIEVPAGLQISNILLESFAGGPVGTKQFEFGETGDVGGIFDGLVVETEFNITSILTPGIYDARTTKVSGSNSYRWTFTAEALVVPLPSAILLLGSGLLALFGFGMRR